VPNFSNVTTIAGQQTWQSDDGRIKKYEVVLDVDGKHFKADTYSEKISQKGWKGDIETYEKADRNGVVRTYVKQPAREGGYPNRGGGGGKSSPADSHTMYTSYVKDIAIALLETSDYSAKKLGEVVDEVSAKGTWLWNQRPDNNSPSRPADANNAISEVFPGAKIQNQPQDTVVEEIGDEPLSLDDLPNL
jgi:hypothetical protein